MRPGSSVVICRGSVLTVTTPTAGICWPPCWACLSSHPVRAKLPESIRTTARGVNPLFLFICKPRVSDFKLVNGQKLINPLLRLYYRRAMVHTFTNVCKSNACKFTNIWHEKPNKKRKKRANTSSMWLYVFSHSRGYHPPRWARLQKQLALRAVQSTGILKTSRICSVRSGNCQNPILVN